MLMLVHPAPAGQGIDPPGRRKGRHSSALNLSPTERRHLAAALHNLRRAFGTWACLADAMGVREDLLIKAASPQSPRPGSPALALLVARAAGMSVEAVLSGTLSAAGRCATCGHRVGDGRLAAGGAS
jgi:hypothetical protein